MGFRNMRNIGDLSTLHGEQHEHEPHQHPTVNTGEHEPHGEHW
jgi:hypothetical protein